VNDSYLIGDLKLVSEKRNANVAKVKRGMEEYRWTKTGSWARDIPIKYSEFALQSWTVGGGKSPARIPQSRCLLPHAFAVSMPPPFDLM
jgi:hypothetical protein